MPKQITLAAETARPNNAPAVATAIVNALKAMDAERKAQDNASAIVRKLQDVCTSVTDLKPGGRYYVTAQAAIAAAFLTKAQHAAWSDATLASSIRKDGKQIKTPRGAAQDLVNSRLRNLRDRMDRETAKADKAAKIAANEPTVTGKPAQPGGRANPAVALAKTLRDRQASLTKLATLGKDASTAQGDKIAAFGNVETIKTLIKHLDAAIKLLPKA